NKINALGSITPGITNFFMQNKATSGLIKKVLGFAPNRSMPKLQKRTLTKEVKRYAQKLNEGTIGSVYLFVDEFSNFNDTAVGVKTLMLLNKLGYKVKTVKHDERGRTFLSKGLLRTAKKLAIKNIQKFAPIISEETPLVGIEPSTILSFRDEYPDLAGNELKETAEKLAKNALMFDEWFMREVEKGNIDKDVFTKEAASIKLHGHCQQKAVASTKQTIAMLNLPENYNVEEIPSGCCGMAGSFGYEKEHYELSIKVGELVLFPAVRKAPKETIIAAPGTSCRHQIKDGTDRDAKHPIEIMYDALK
ncbi:MAG: FAD-binding oxidoreductase, partial [Salinivirgaceae bacterium]